MASPITCRAGALRRVRLLSIIGCVWLVWTSPAWANQPPSGQMFLAEILILPLMMLLTVLGGGYAIMRAAGAKRRRWLILVAVVAIFLTGIQEGLSALLMLVFGPYALVRGVRLILWGVGAMRPPEKRAAYLALASPTRLVTAGLLTCLMVVALVGLNFAFVGWFPRERYAEEDLKRVVAYELIRGKDHKDVGGQPQYEAPRPYQPEGASDLAFGEMIFTSLRYKEAPRGLRGSFVGEFKLGPGAKSFQVWVWPEQMPFFPYNYLVTVPSFYADQTGQMRMIRVHKNGERCPPDAPVYYRVRPEDAPPPS